MDIYLQSFGARLRVKGEVFEVTVPDLTGADRHVQEQFAPHEVEAILLQKGTSVSTDALLLAMEKQTDIIILDHFGQPQGRILSNRPNSTMLIWKNQLAASNSKDGLMMAKGWVEEKLRNQVAFLHKLKSRRSEQKVQIIEKAAAQISEMLARLHLVPINTQTADIIRGYEGTAGRIYFETLSDLLPDEYRFQGRGKRPASDLFNAYLNYTYGILYRMVEKALLRAGVHPHIGFMHFDGYQNKSMLYDFIEPFRIWADKTVFHLFSRKMASPLQSTEHLDGRITIQHEAKTIIATTFKKRMLEKTVECRGKLFPLDLFLQTQAIELASWLRGYQWSTLS